MQKILRNVPPLQKIVPGTLENTRPPSDYQPAAVKAYNDRYKGLWAIDAAKAKLISVRQISTKPWLANVILGEDIYGADGKFLTTKQMNTQIERQEWAGNQLTIERVIGETPFETWKKVEAAAGLEENELVADLLLPPNAQSTIYPIATMSLNYYGNVRVRFTYKEAVITPPNTGI